MKKTLCLSFLAFLLVPLPAGAASKDNLMQDVFVLDTITVTDENKREELHGSSAVVVENNRSNTIADFLVRDPEVSFKRRSAFGDSNDIISIRGMDSKRIMLNLDGRNIGSTGSVGGSYMDFGTIPLDNIERIEILKGGSSVEYGNAALGGVINAYSRRPKEDPYLSFYATLGGWGDVYDFHNVRGTYSQKFNAVGVSLGLSQQHADPFLRNNYYNAFHFNPKVYLDLPWRGELIFGYNYSQTERGLIRSNRADGVPNNDANPNLPGYNTKIDSDYPLASGETFSGGTPTPAMTVIGDDAHWTKYRHMMDITYRQEFLDTGFFETMVFKNYESRREKNYADNAARALLPGGPNGMKYNSSLTPEGSLVLDRNLVMDQSYGYKFKTGIEVLGNALLTGIEYKQVKPGAISVEYVDRNYNKAGPNQWTGNMASSEATSPSDVFGIFFADKFTVFDVLTFDFGLRYDSYAHSSDEVSKRFFEDKVSPKFMLTYDFTENQSASVAVYQNFRTPTGPELLHAAQAASSVVPYLKDKYIKPETARGIDLAYKYAFSNSGFVKLTGFYYNIEDYIMQKSVPIPNSTSSIQGVYNMDAEIYGATLSAGYAPIDCLMLRAAVTRQDSKKHNDPADPNNVLEKLDYIPDWKAVASAEWKINDQWTLDTNLTYVGERNYYVSTINPQKDTLHPYTTLGASLRYQVDEHLTLEAYADNITNTQYEESWGYPALGFNAGVSLKWEL